MSLWEKFSEERKDLQSRGKLPKFVTTAGYSMLVKKYVEPGKTVEDRYRTIAKSTGDIAKELYGDGNWEDTFFDVMWKGWLSPSTPLLANMGTTRGLPISCESSYIGDSIYDFYDSLKEAAVLTKHGFGTSAYLGDIRGRGSKFSDNGKANGVVPVFEDFVAMTDNVSQGCYTEDTEVFTENGWLPFSKLRDMDIRVAQVHESGEVDYVYPSDYIEYHYSGDMIRFRDSKNIDVLVTPNHNMITRLRMREDHSRVNGKYLNNKKYVRDSFDFVQAENRTLHRDVVFMHGSNTVGSKNFSAEDAFRIMHQADGSYCLTSKTAYRFRFKKQRKIDRFFEIVNELPYKVTHRINDDGVFEAYVQTHDLELPKYNKDFSWVDLSGGSEYLTDVLMEIAEWDGSWGKNSPRSGFSYSNICREAVEQVQTIAMLAGLKARVSEVVRDEPRKTLYFAHVSVNGDNLFGGEKVQKTLEEFDGTVYCVTVPTHALLVRSNGHTLVCGNSTRRGSWAGYLPLDHPDFNELSDKLIREPANLNVGWVITDSFKKRLLDGDKEALSIWGKVLKIRMITGKGYMWFVDDVNRQQTESYKQNGLKNKSSNLCVSGDTMVFTSDGAKRIRDLVDTPFNAIVNGNKYHSNGSWSNGLKTVGKLTTKEGYEIVLTPDHKLLAADGSWAEAQDLIPGDQIMINNHRDFEMEYGNEDEKDIGYLVGHFVGDGNFTKSGAQVKIWSGEFDSMKDQSKIMEKVAAKHFVGRTDRKKTFSIHSSGVNKMMEIGRIPDENGISRHDGKTNISNIETKSSSFISGFLSGLFDTDGHVECTSDKKVDHINTSVRLAQSDINFMKSVQRMLLKFGIKSKIYDLKEEQMTLLPDGHGGQKEYLSRKSWRLVINGDSIPLFIEKIGFKDVSKRDKLDSAIFGRTKGFYKKPFVATVESFEIIGEEEVFDVTVDDIHAFDANGLIAHNCSEISLYSDEDHSYTCVLSSLNLEKYDEWKDTDLVFIATVFLDCVAEEFIRRAREIPGLEKAVRYTEKARSLGLGVMGYHSYLQRNMIPFESEKARKVNKDIFKSISEQAYSASEWMGKKAGVPEWCVGVRNSHQMAIAPTMSTSLILGGVSQGIEPVVANVFTQATAAGEMARINPEFLHLMKSKGKYNQETIDDLIEHDGSVQHVDWLSGEEKAVFKTAYELDQFELVQQASDRQQYIDQGQSLNLFFTANEDPKYISSVHKKAMLDNNVKGLYYCRSQAGVKASNGKVNNGGNK